MIVARRLQVGSRFVVPSSALKYGGALVQVVKRSYQTWGGEPFISVEFQGVDVPEIRGTVGFPPATELDEP